MNITILNSPSMLKEISSLQYLTQDLLHRSHEEQVQIACEAGVKWIQLRVKNKSHDEWLAIAKKVKKITDEFDVTLIVNDSVEIAKEVDVDGVHLGQEDLSPLEARKILGEEKIIGYSTHSLNEILAAKDFDIDYFGLGPFHFTSTKEKLDPVLGVDGIATIVQRTRRAGILKPIIAIGGIQLNDMKQLMEARLDGVAVSSAINFAVDPAMTIKKFQKLIETSKLKLQTQQ